VGVILASLALLLRTPGGPYAPPPTAVIEPEPPAAPSFPTAEARRSQWPAFRGPQGSGQARIDPAPPTTWDGATGEGIRWKVPVPRSGFSSPVVWGNRVVLTGGDETAREIYCFDADTGALLWQHLAANIAGSPPEPPDVTEDTGYAAATMTTDGERFFAIFATGDLVCVDMDGRRVWARNLGVPDNPYGHASSLLMHDDLLLVQLDHGEEANLWGLRAADGEVAWKTAREVDTSWASPILVEHEGRPLVLVLAAPDLAAYDPVTGERFWQTEGVGGEIGPSPAYADGLAFVANAYERLAALRVGSEDPEVWTYDEWLPNIPSPLAHQGYLVLATEDALMICFRAATGEELWTQEFDEGFYASPIGVGDLVYALDMTGVMHIFRPGETYHEVATSALGEETLSTPAFHHGRIYVRGQKHLFCVEAGGGA
jgi:outer membrane protein assembly factor BamB